MSPTNAEPFESTASSNEKTRIHVDNPNENLLKQKDNTIFKAQHL